MKLSNLSLYFIIFFLIFSNYACASSIDGTTSPKYLTTNQVFHNNQYARGFVKLKSGATILSDATAFFGIHEPLTGALDLRGTGTLSLEENLYLDSNFTLSGSGVIRGNNKTIFLGGNLTIPDNSVLHINSNTVIDGQGNNLTFGKRSKLFVDTNITLTLQNMRIVQTFNNFSDACIRLAALKSKLALNNVELALSNDFLFNQGQLFIYGDVVVTGTSAFVYKSTQHSFIMPESTFYFDIGTTFSVTPATFTDCRFDQWPTYTANNFILMSNQTSKLKLNQVSFCTTATGSRIAKGAVDFDNRCFIKSNSALDFPSPYLEATNQIVTTGNSPACTAYSPDGNYLAVVNKQSNSLQIFNSTSLAQIGSDVNTGSSPVSVSWSNTSTQLAVANSGDNTVKVFNFTGATTPTLSLSAATGIKPSCVAWSTYGKYIAVTSAGSNTLQIFRSSTLLPIGTGAVTGSIPSSVDWAIGDRFLAVTNSGANTFQIFSFNGSTTPVQITNTATGFIPSSVAWARNGTFLSVANSGSHNLQTFSFDISSTLSLMDVLATDYVPNSVTWTLDSNYCAVINYISNSLQFFRLYNTSSLIQAVGSGDYSYATAWSPYGEFQAVVDYSNSVLQIFTSGGVQVGGDARTGFQPVSVAWSPDGRFIAVLGQLSGSLQIFTFSGHSTPTQFCGSVTFGDSIPYSSTVSWSPDGIFIAVNIGGPLQIFSLDTDGNINQISNGISTKGGPTSASWSSNGTNVAVVNEKSNELQLFQLEQPAVAVQVGGNASTGIYPEPVSWSPGGNLMAIVSRWSNTLQIFSFNGLNTPIQIATTSTADYPQSVAWSPDGKFVAVACGVISISWSPDGKFIASESEVIPAISNVIQIFSFDGINLGVPYICSVSGVSVLSIFSFNGSSNPTLVGSINTGVSPSSVSWSSDGRFISVVSDAHILQIFSFDGVGAPVQVGNDVPTGLYPRSVAWSPDNRFIGVVSSASAILQIFSFNGLSTPTQVGGNVPTGEYPYALSWSPDGNFIGVASANLQVLQIFYFDGSNSPAQVGENISTPIYPRAVSWSPDGNFLAVPIITGYSDPGYLQVFKVNYVADRSMQSISNGVVFGNSNLGAPYDTYINVLAGSNVNVDGLVNYDCVN